MIVTDGIEEYFSLMRQKPELFVPSDVYPIVTDRAVLEAFQRESGKRVGVLYKSCFNTLVVDLVGGEGGYFTYERVIPTSNECGVVCVPVMDGKFLLLRQYRHPIRERQLCFPRGFGEDGISPEENAKKELWEETGAIAKHCAYIGSLTPDSGLIGAGCRVFLCFVDSLKEEALVEGIENTLWLDERELEEKIKKREINDGFTLGAYMLYKTK